MRTVRGQPTLPVLHLSTTGLQRFEGSLPRNICCPDPVVVPASTSVVPLTARGRPLVLSIIHYYIDGTLLKSIPRISGLAETNQAYSTLLDINSTLGVGEERGFRSIFAIAEDNSGNYVSSAIHTISFTKGAEVPPTLSITSGLLGLSADPSTLDVNITGGSLTGMAPLVGTFGQKLLAARVEITADGSGSGALVNPVIDTDPSSSDYGKITGFTVVDGGSNYESDTNFTLKIIPVIRSVNQGIEGQLEYASNPPMKPMQPVVLIQSFPPAILITA